MENSHIFKVVFLGNAGVGKTCLVRRYAQNFFPVGHGATIGVDFLNKEVTVGGKTVRLQLWDTAGQERFRSLTHSYYRSAHAIVLVFDISNQCTFDTLANWLDEIATYGNPAALHFLVGNKSDLLEEREVPWDVAKGFADEIEFGYVETSAKTSDQVEQMFRDISEILLARTMAETRFTRTATNTKLSMHSQSRCSSCGKSSPPTQL